ncbi:MAG: TrkH family potassium uptake protein [Bacteroidales bacterium]|nr:TrkH family potassium uptake protein [Bacteroidales bacterium]
MNFRIVLFILSRLLAIESLIISISGLVSLFYGDIDFLYFFYSSGIALAVSILVFPFVKNTKRSLGKREGYLVVSLTWVVFSIFGALPFYISGAIPSYTDAFFETMSGFTTTGASILNDIESLSHGLLFWRSITQWLGGMGIIVMAIAILPILGIGGMQLFIAEVPGPTPDKLHPRIKGTAKRLWGIYIILTLMETLLLMLGNMDWFDALNHSFTTMATGGYSTKQMSVAYYNSPYIEYIISLFMFLAGMNFTLAFFALKLKWKKIFRNEEFKWYAIGTLLFTLIIVFFLVIQTGLGIEPAFRQSLFQVVSILTTTGYATADYMLWPSFVVVIIFMLMFIGGSAGSTGGGPKVLRIMLLLKNSYFEFKRLIHPKAIIPVRFNKRAVDPKIIANIQAFLVVYIILFVIGTISMSAIGLDLDSSMGAVIACLGNIGPGIADVGPANNFYNIPDVGKWILSFAMLVGRLELFTVLVLFTPHYWKK